MTDDYKFGIGSTVWPGLAKTMEEAGEVLQLLGKIVARGGDLDHTWPCKDCGGAGHLGPSTGASQRDYGRACHRCDGRGSLGSGDLSDAIHEELGDLQAAIEFLIETNDVLNADVIYDRFIDKLNTYRRWHESRTFLPLPARSAEHRS